MLMINLGRRTIWWSVIQKFVIVVNSGVTQPPGAPHNSLRSGPPLAFSLFVGGPLPVGRPVTRRSSHPIVTPLVVEYIGRPYLQLQSQQSFYGASYNTERQRLTKKKAVLLQGNRAMPQLFFSV